MVTITALFTSRDSFSTAWGAPREAEQRAPPRGRERGIFCGLSSGGATHAALQLSRDVNNAVIVTIICDRGDRYLSTGVFPD